MNLQQQKGLGSLKKLQSTLPSGITLRGARIKPLKITGGTLIKPKIRVKLIQNALRNNLGKIK